jgi:hypothetical protein
MRNSSVSLLTGLNREEKADLVLKLYEAGFLQQQIADMLGRGHSYINSLLRDPTGAKEDVRKRSHHGTCIDCGGKTFNGGARARPIRCKSCAATHDREELLIWTRGKIVACIREWAELYGEPPRATDWLKQVEGSPGQYTTGPREEWAGKRRWPTVTSIQRESALVERDRGAGSSGGSTTSAPTSEGERH